VAESDIPLIDRSSLPTPGAEPAIILVDKPGGMTSFAVVRRVRRLIGVKKVGHAGTLDPMATGLLIVLVGRAATRKQDEFMGMRKVYSGTLRLGQTTASYDAESEVVEHNDASHITDVDLEAVREQFLGDIEQLPPMYSAVKIAGERLYKKARRGEEVERALRPVNISRLEFTARRGDDVDFVAESSKGTYIRTLAHDIGQALGVGAHLVALRRDASGSYDVRDAWGLEELEAEMMKDEVKRIKDKG
jgi:tRNA pseudouridine55 synthase